VSGGSVDVLYTPANLARHGLQLGALLAAVPALTLPELVRAGVVTRPSDYALLGLDVAAALAAHLPPATLRHALPRDARDRAELRAALGVTPKTWLAHAAALAPRDLRALGIDLSAWLAAHPRLLRRAQESAHTWLAQAPPEQWQRKARLLPAHYAQLSGTPLAALLPAAAPAVESGRRTLI
jgi:hypothetical protein